MSPRQIALVRFIPFYQRISKITHNISFSDTKIKQEKHTIGLFSKLIPNIFLQARENLYICSPKI
jgi:hypothetical protein